MAYNVGIVGATGVTGGIALRILAERAFPVGDLRLFASQRSAGRRVVWSGREVVLQPLAQGAFRGLDVVLNATDSDVAIQWAPRVVEEGAVFIDKSSAFRQDPAVPLVIPEINGGDATRHRGIIASPNCTTAVAVMAMAPIHRAARICTAISSSYQSVSGVGRDAIVELLEETKKAVDQPDALRGEARLDLPEPQVLPHPLAFNLFPQCETFPEGADESTEESKMQPEVRKILGDPDLVLHPTAVRVPVVVGHSVSLSLSLERAMSPDEAREVCAAFPGVRVLDDAQARVYPTPLLSTGIDDILVGRIRRNPVLENGLSLFASGDNLRKGAALNAIQIAELILGL